MPPAQPAGVATDDGDAGVLEAAPVLALGVAVAGALGVAVAGALGAPLVLGSVVAGVDDAGAGADADALGAVASGPGASGLSASPASVTEGACRPRGSRTVCAITSTL